MLGNNDGGCSILSRLTTMMLMLFPSYAFGAAAADICKDAASCQAHMRSISQKLDTMRDEMNSRTHTLQALEELRTGILSGKRIELPSAIREHLERESPLIGEISYDARHRPVSTNVTRHFQHVRTIAGNSKVLHHAFLPLKRSAAASQRMTSALIVTVDSEMTLSLNSLDGETVLDRLPLGHASGSTVKFMELSPNQENHFVMTGDDRGEIRVHNLKITAKAEKTEGGDVSDDEVETKPKPNVTTKTKLYVTANYSGSIMLPRGPGSEERQLKAMLPIERTGKTFFVTGDHLGGISVFMRNGTVKGRVKVTEDPGGVIGLQRSQGQMILFWSSHSFGFFSVSQLDVSYPPCTGWNSPLYHVSIDPSFSASRVILALTDGDVLVFNTQRGKSKACDLTLKFPHVSVMPFQLHSFRGHVMGLPTPLDNMARKEEYMREIFFFNLAAMEAGYGVSPSRAVSLQLSFKPRQPEHMALHGGLANTGDRKSQIALRFANSQGVELYDLSLKTPPPPQAAGGGSGNDDSWTSNLLNWVPKVGVFGVALVGVVIWNVRKVTSQKKFDAKDDFDDELFRKRLMESREKRSADKVGGGMGMGGENTGAGLNAEADDLDDDN
mmetsp:Transcript_136986/g.266544  ORF Transcript_136986/g.266544 Transcript_136986/m.266544 type:complete len:612 (-) Transcript_136986:154-1989(-)